MRLPDAFRPDLRAPLTQTWLASLWMGLACNWPLWLKLQGLEDVSGGRGLLFTIVFAAVVVAGTGALLSLLAWPRLSRAVLGFLLLASSALAYFIGSYGIVFDPGMVVNTLQTDVRETRDLLSWRLAASLVLLGALPAWWLWRQPAAPAVKPLRRLLHNGRAFGLGLLAMVLLMLTVFADFSSTHRNHKELRYLITPLNAVYSIGAVAFQRQAAPKGPPTVIGVDARLLPRPEGARPPLLMLVVGETARAMNFSLNGYARPTTPELAKLPVLSFTDVSSCGTATAASLPCMFSPLGREAFDPRASTENLLDVLQRAGLAVLWLDNQSGCKGLCERVPNAETPQLPPGAAALPPGLCDGEECFDEALLHELDKRIAALDPERVKRGVVLVLHQMGSHGPAYYKRSPPDLKPFQPECRSNALQRCAREEVINGYDNTIATTDRMLARAIGWLQGQQARFTPGMYYVSDHGESLGEKGLYLHGMPYAMAPREQTHVPMILWTPQADRAACLTAKRRQPVSHDHIFHTVMGWMGARADVYKAEWDLLAGCP
ncbi:phosphoethanolamine transferase [Roseateles paludis]|uniref:Phosphoethanolamine--lipid A transferase n=1 Tax=Roseateles paludis TaxID=3145238 RepID=A0ABV0G4T6_9BURK